MEKDGKNSFKKQKSPNQFSRIKTKHLITKL